MEKLLNTKEVCEILGVSLRSLYRYINSGMLKAVKVGKVWRFKEEDIKEFINSGN